MEQVNMERIDHSFEIKMVKLFSCDCCSLVTGFYILDGELYCQKMPTSLQNRQVIQLTSDVSHVHLIECVGN